MTKFVSILSTLALAVAGAVGGAAAHAETLAPIEGQSVDLGHGVHGTIYYVADRDGRFVVTATFDEGEGSTPVRFEALLADGQRIAVSAPRNVGQPAQRVEIRRIRNEVDVFETDRLHHGETVVTK